MDGRLVPVVSAGVLFPSKVRLVGVKAVETSEIESFFNWPGVIGGEADGSDLTTCSERTGGAVAGGTGNSGIADRGGSPSVELVNEVLRRGISSNFQSF
jgi:hypothetical protein